VDRVNAAPRPTASKFRRLAITHALMMGGDAAMVVALADSLFFDIDLDAARSRVLLFLVIGFAPFLVVAPLIGPLIDRVAGGRKFVIEVVALSRVVLTLLMAQYLDALVLFPLVFASLVLQKTYAVSKSAIVPSTVRSDVELVEANSKLGLIAGITGAVAVVPAGILLKVIGAPATLVYGALLFSHVTVAALLVAAFELLVPRSPRVPGLRAPLLAGALCGLATLTEYPAGLATAVLGLGVLAGPARWRKLAAFVAGGLPFAAGLAVYNRALFNSALSLSSANEAYADTATLASRGLFGITGPTVESVFTLLASPSRGLFFFSPVLVFGLVALWPRGDGPGRTRALVRLAVVGTLGLAMLAYPANAGGWCVGARYLVAIVPFLVLAAAERGVRPGATFAASLAFSAVLCVLPLLTFPFAPREFTFVHATLVRPFLAASFATPNLGSWVTPGLVSLLPVVVAAVAAVALALLGGGRRALAGAMGGALLATGIVLAPVHDTVAMQAFRALLLDTHFHPAGRLQRLAAESADRQLRAQLVELAELCDGTRQLAPDDWPYGE